jgi:hypothetical protein
MKNFFILLVAVIVVAAGVSVWWYVTHTQTSRQAWTAVLKNCADSDLLGKDTVYFGVSNQIGPGSIWRRDKDGSLRLRYELSDIEPEPAKQAALIQLNNQVSCKGSSSSNWQIKFGLPFESAVTPVSADVGSDLRRADNVTVSVNGWAVDELKEGLYEQLIQNSAMKGEFSTSDRLVVENAYRIIGFSATFHFAKSIADQLKGKYKGSTVSTQDGASLQTSWSNDTALTIQAPGTFYLLAAFGTLPSEGASSFTPQEQLPEHVVNERQTALSDLKIGEAVVQLLAQQAPTKHPAVQVTNGVVNVDGLGDDRRLQKELAQHVGNIHGAKGVEFAGAQAVAGPTVGKQTLGKQADHGAHHGEHTPKPNH